MAVMQYKLSIHDVTKKYGSHSKLIKNLIIQFESSHPKKLSMRYLQEVIKRVNKKEDEHEDKKRSIIQGY